MVDQEGGRVARLRPPHWRAHPPAATLGRCFAANRAAGLRAAFLTGALIGLDCAAVGFDVAAAPVLDLGLPGASNVVGDRAFAADPTIVARLGRAMAAGLLAAGTQPVGKHAPGHGRAPGRSRTSPFPACMRQRPAPRPAAVRAEYRSALADDGTHCLCRLKDPILPATVSRAVIGGISIRGRLGFFERHHSE